MTSEAMNRTAANEKESNPLFAGMETERRTPREQLEISDEEFTAMGEVAAMYYQQGKLDEAQAIFEGLVEIDPESGAAQAALGALLTRKRQDTEALPHLSRAIEIEPEMIAPHVNRAEIYIRQQKAEEALADLKRAIELDPEEADTAANRARAMALGIYEVLKAHTNTKTYKPTVTNLKGD